jgi:hypothetical protein
LTYAKLIAWIEAHFPDADYHVSVSSSLKRPTCQKRMDWVALVWPPNRTLNVQGLSAEHLRIQLEAYLEPPARLRFDLVDPENVSE